MSIYSMLMNFEKFRECKAILFDYGGTLDSDGEHWLDRFFLLYEEADLHVPRPEIKRAFYHADDVCYVDKRVTTLGLRALMEFHVHLQFEALSLVDNGKEKELVDKFCAKSEKFLSLAGRLFNRMRPRYRLGVVSNFYGNLTSLLKEAELLGLLDVIADSKHVGIRKPDPGIFRFALEKLDLPPEQVIFVGDSYDRDMVPSGELGMKTVWLNASHSGASATAKVDACISSLSQLEVLSP